MGAKAIKLGSQIRAWFFAILLERNSDTEGHAKPTVASKGSVDRRSVA